MTVDTIAVIGAITTLLVGMWAMFRYIIKTFLGHLEQKNGHNERIVKEFSETVKGFQSVMACLSEQIKRANENQLNVQGVLNDCARALNEHHKNCQK